MTQRDSSTGSSSSMDTDEEWEQDAQMCGTFIQQATASSSIHRSRATNTERGQVAANERLMQDYFCDNPTYTDEMFKRCFRMRKDLFIRIVHDLSTRYRYFQLYVNAKGEQGFSPIQKYTAAIWQLVYEISGDAFEEYVCMGEKTSRDCLHNFSTSIIEVYGKVYLRKPSYQDIQRLYARA
ncbi:hypothetical protein OSB04_031972 [Centaurea solstitialis]|uniref:Uncharacterized protein n=1 Tax=Centaurea solstitialis TaxID=347529 RepID=A0AA38W6J5_9ASTR|nr:hypothetical protein OSB04_031972 [Centaurea solstitialis]